MPQLLSDILSRPSKSTSIFTALLVSSTPHYSLVTSPATKLTVLAPLNSAVDSLPGKIWEVYPPTPPQPVLTFAENGDTNGTQAHISFPPDASHSIPPTSTLMPTSSLTPTPLTTPDPTKLQGDEGFVRAQQNEQTFLSHHLVQAFPWKEGEKANTVAGGQVWWETRGGNKVIMPAEVEVASVDGSVDNGDLWTIRGVLGVPTDKSATTMSAS